jgi:HK97 family phage prohead protease
LEVRAAPLELRITTGRRLTGYAAIFNSPATIGAFQEIILPGAFRSDLLSGRDALLLSDHDVSRVLARTKAGSLRMVETGKGLHFEADVAATSVGNDVLELVRSGNAGGMSFGFRVKQDRWPTRERRELVEVELFEISVVSAWPAYPQTEVAARARALMPPSPSPRLMLARRWLETVR